MAPGGWRAGPAGWRRRPAYHLPALLAAPLDTPVYLPEGETKADLLRSWGLLAVSSGYGSAVWPPEYDAAFTGARSSCCPITMPLAPPTSPKPPPALAAVRGLRPGADPARPAGGRRRARLGRRRRYPRAVGGAGRRRAALDPRLPEPADPLPAHSSRTWRRSSTRAPSSAGAPAATTRPVEATVAAIAPAQAADPHLFSQDGAPDLYTLVTSARANAGSPPRRPRRARPSPRRHLAHRRPAPLQRAPAGVRAGQPPGGAGGRRADFLPAHCPPLAGVTDIPAFRPDGSLHTAPAMIRDPPLPRPRAGSATCRPSRRPPRRTSRPPPCACSPPSCWRTSPSPARPNAPTPWLLPLALRPALHHRPHAPCTWWSRPPPAAVRACSWTACCARRMARCRSTRTRRRRRDREVAPRPGPGP